MANPVVGIACALLAAGWSPAAALSVKRLYPENGAPAQCPDTPLRMILSGKPVLAWSGSARIRDLSDNTVVKTWTLSGNPGHPDQAMVREAWPWKDSVGHTFRNVWPVVIDSVPEYLAEIRLPQRLLRPGTRYQVEVDAGILKGADGSAFAGVPAGGWTFTTRARPAPKGRVVVAEDNSGDVCSVQGGVDLVPSGSQAAVQVLIKPGYYREMVAAKNKDRLELFGAGRDRTFLRYCNSNNLNDGSSLRNLVSLGGNDMHLRAFAVVNTIGVAGGQAEALFLQGDRNVVGDVLLRSHQDTWLNSGGRVYVQDAVIEGSVDFIWGYSPAFFKRCTLVFTRKGSVLVQPRNPAGSRGYVFDSCTFKARSPEYTGSRFARDGGASYAQGEVVVLNSTLVGEILAPSPWTIDIDASQLKFCEYGSRDADGRPVAITDSQRKQHQCTGAEAARYADPAYVLAGWKPTVPSLGSVLSQIPVATRASSGIGPSPSARVVRSGAVRHLEILGPGQARVREIRADGTTRPLFRCTAPCVERLETTPKTPVWLEVAQPGFRTLLRVNP